jgi:tetratricopeptide (TPR) repeat protein
VVLRASRLAELVPGEIATVKLRRRWIYGGTPYLAGDIVAMRLEVAALGLTPLRLTDCGMWDPAENYWGEEGEPIADWAKPIIVKGPREEYEMEQSLPGEDPEDAFNDPILEANDCKEMGDFLSAREILMDLCQEDLRCLDAHAHLGNLVFPDRPEDALRHFEVGFRIGELSLPKGFNGLLPWGWIDNRPFLRCMHGYGLCLWRLEKFEEAYRIFERTLWLNPSDNQGARFLLGGVRRREPWKNIDEV